jgi:hypothetical protein
MHCCVSLEHLLQFESQIPDDQQQLQQICEELRQQIDNLNKQHAELLETERMTIRSKYEIAMEQLQEKYQLEIEHIRRGKHCVVGVNLLSITYILV